jgi:ectoine hydroxylase-related dioxygenase (phytanoyl-CoA dioxygenase family)
VALTPWTARTGTLRTWDGPASRPVALDPGDAVLMSPDQPHAAGTNRSGAVRAGVYFRWLQP